MVAGMALGPYQGKETGELALLRELLVHFMVGDILLCDRCYCSYFLIVMLREMGVDVVTRLHQMRTANFCRGRRLASVARSRISCCPSRTTRMRDLPGAGPSH